MLWYLWTVVWVVQLLEHGLALKAWPSLRGGGPETGHVGVPFSLVDRYFMRNFA